MNGASIVTPSVRARRLRPCSARRRPRRRGAVDIRPPIGSGTSATTRPSSTATWPPPISASRADGDGHVARAGLVARADDHAVVRVVRDRRRDRAACEPEARHPAEPDPAGLRGGVRAPRSARCRPRVGDVERRGARVVIMRLRRPRSPARARPAGGARSSSAAVGPVREVHDRQHPVGRGGVAAPRRRRPRRRRRRAGRAATRAGAEAVEASRTRARRPGSPGASDPRWWKLWYSAAVHRREHERVLDRTRRAATARRTQSFDVAAVEDEVGLAVVGAERDVRGAAGAAPSGSGRPGSGSPSPRG